MSAFRPSCAALLVALVACARAPAPAPGLAVAPVAVGDLRQVFLLRDGLYSGSGPQGAADLAALRSLGVRTLLSVDGARPDVVAAQALGMRYVHLPIGYDGVPATVSTAVAKAIRELPGPLYVHCHHGQHRGPAAAAAGAVVAGLCDHAQAEAFLRAAGTGEQYAGLWTAVRTARAADPEALRAQAVDWRPVAPVSPLVTAMVAAGDAFGDVGELRGARWRAPAHHPDLSPAHTALLLREAFVEAAREPGFAQRPERYRAWMAKAEGEARGLEAAVAAWAAAGRDAPPPAALEQRYAALKAGCGECHMAYRNPPQQ